MRRRVAIAIGRRFRDPKAAPNDDALAALFDLAAGDAIAAMREPTDAMAARGHGAGWHGGIEGDPEPEAEAAASLWRAMIDAALR